MSERLAHALAPALEELVDLVARRVVELQHEATPSAATHDSPWLGVERAAAYLDWPRQRLYKLTARSEIPHYKQEGRLLFHRGELDAWLARFAEGERPC